jgi:hypothetical protein
VIIAIAVIAVLWVNRAKFGLVSNEPPPPPPPPPVAVVSNQATAMTPVVPLPEEVDFNEDAPWTKSWTKLFSLLAQQKYQLALDESENLKQLTRNLPYQRRWAVFMEGVTLLVENRMTEARPIFLSDGAAVGKGRMPEKITPTNFVGPLLALMTDELSPQEVAADPAKMPDWAAALTQFMIGLKQYNAGQLDDAKNTFRQYEKLPVDKTQPWAYSLQPLAKKLADEIEHIPASLAGFDKQEKAGQLDAALKAIRDARGKTRIVSYKAALDEREARIVKAQQEIKHQTDAARQAALDKAHEAEEQSKAKAEQAKANAEVEVKRVQAADPTITAPLAVYDFAAALAKYQPLTAKLESADGQKALNQRLAAMRWLMEFKAQLIADIRAKPFDGAQMVTRQNMTLQGQLVRASETELTFQLPYGEMQSDWRDFAPATWQKLGEFYAQAYAASEKPPLRARRYLALAVLAKQYNLNYTSDLKQAAQLDPSLQPDIDLIFGKSADQ